MILGQSGVGKSTFLHILAGILKPRQGSVLYNNQELYQLSPGKMDKFRGQNIGIIFQRPHFVQALSAEENLLIAQKLAGQNINRNSAQEILSRLQLDHRKNAKTYNLSQGELQRLSIARAVINGPAVILADEPTSALDDQNCNEVVKLLQHQAELVNACLVIVTHDNRLKSLFPNKVELN